MHRLQPVCQGAVVNSAADKWSLQVLLHGVCQCIDQILESRSWAKAFADTGLTGTRAGVCARVHSKLTFERILAVGSSLPTLAQLVNVFPKRAVLPIDNLFGLFLTPSTADGPHGMPHVDTTVAPAVPDDMQPGTIARSRAASNNALLTSLAPEPCLAPRPMQPCPQLR